MKLIIAGGRDFELGPFGLTCLDQIRSENLIEEVVSGGARGADAAGEAWATRNNLPVKKFLPEWEKFGRAAGPKRNEAMAEYADAVVLFPGGKGTASMAKLAIKLGLKIFDLRKIDL